MNPGGEHERGRTSGTIMVEHYGSSIRKERIYEYDSFALFCATSRIIVSRLEFLLAEFTTTQAKTTSTVKVTVKMNIRQSTYKINVMGSRRSPFFLFQSR